MVASIAKRTSARYYLRQAEYYLSGREPTGVWLSTSSTLGITAGNEVNDLFEKLQDGIGSDGKALLTNDGGRNDRVGYDITLSAPKSVSILYALAVPTTRAAIEQVQLDASRRAIGVSTLPTCSIDIWHGGAAIRMTVDCSIAVTWCRDRLDIFARRPQTPPVGQPEPVSGLLPIAGLSTPTPLSRSATGAAIACPAEANARFA